MYTFSSRKSNDGPLWQDKLSGSVSSRRLEVHTGFAIHLLSGRKVDRIERDLWRTPSGRFIKQQESGSREGVVVDLLRVSVFVDDGQRGFRSERCGGYGHRLISGARVWFRFSRRLLVGCIGLVRRCACIRGV